MQESHTDQNVTQPQESIAPYRRSALRASGSILLWVLAAIAFLLALFSLAFTVLTGSYLANVPFYLFIAIGLVFFGIAVWRRRDPRPRRFTGRILTVAGTASLVAAFVSSSVLGTGDSKPILFASQRYDLAGGLASAGAPGTDGWESTREKTVFADTVNFARNVGLGRTADDNETLRASLSVIRAPGNALSSGELIAQALDTEKRSNTGGRNTDLRFTTSAVSSPPSCLRYDWTVNDTGVAKFPGSVFKLTSHGLMCTDRSVTNLIEIYWSHRYLEGTEPKVAESSAEPFLASLKLSEAASPEASPLASPHAPGTVLFRDNFKDPSGRWSPMDNEFARMRYVPNDGFEVELRRFAHAHVSSSLVPIARDVEVDVEYRVASTAQAEYGPTCRLDDAFGTFYVFLVTTDGTYGIKRNVNGKLKDLSWSAGTFRADLVAPASVQIVAQCYGDGPVTLVLSVNGKTLLRLQDTDGAIKSAGRASFYANGQAGPAMHLDAFTIRDLSR